MIRVHYTQAAAKDLEEIAAYTRRKWGPRQCGIYLEALEQSCEEFLPQNVAATLPVPRLPEFRRWRCWHHIIYFRLTEDGIELVRVLHERMLPNSHL